MGLDEIATDLHETAIEKGFWPSDYAEVDVNFVLAKLALVHSEVSEVLEAVRKQQGAEKVVEEMADIIIRLLDLYEGMARSGWLGVHPPSLDLVTETKASKNKERPRLHGNLI